MKGQAIILMLVSVLVIWGGLIASATALVVRGRREKREADAANRAKALETILADE